MKALLVLPTLLLVFLLVITDLVYAQSAVLTATVRPNPLNISLSAPPSVNVGQWFDAEVTITNHGGVPVSKASAVMHTPAGVNARGKKKRLGSLNPGQTQVVWQMKLTRSGSKLVILVEVEGVLNGETITADETAIISSTSPLAFFWRRLFFGT